jgi:Ni/Fe-hydrogenase subunit HybB-like protein
MTVWPNFKSPLLWDVFAVGTYFTVSLLFWYTGLIPDLATLRDRSTRQVAPAPLRLLRPRLARQQPPLAELRARVPDPRRHLDAAGLSVHSVVSMDFATSVIPGWHTTIFPPYFVAGAVFSGFAMVETVLLIARTVFKLQRVVTMRHLELMNKFLL